MSEIEFIFSPDFYKSNEEIEKYFKSLDRETLENLKFKLQRLKLKNDKAPANTWIVKNDFLTFRRQQICRCLNVVKKILKSCDQQPTTEAAATRCETPPGFWDLKMR